MNSLQSSLYTAALALWIFSSGLLRERSKGRGISVSYFSVFLAVESAGLVFELLMAHPQVPLKSLWLGLRMATSLTVAPALWLAVRELTEGERPKLSSLGRINIGLTLAGAAFTLPLIGSAHFGVTYSNPDHPTALWYSRVIHGTMLACIAVFAWQVPSYLWRCRQRLVAQFKSEETAGRIHELGAQTWLHLPLVIVFTTWVLGLLRTVHCMFHAPQGFGLLFSAADVGVTIGAIYTMVRRASSVTQEPARISLDQPAGIVTAAPPTEPAVVTVVEFAPAPAESIASPLVVPEPVIAPPAISSPETKPAETIVPTETKYAKSSLPPAIRKRIKRKLHAALMTREVCRDSLLSLRSLSAILKENAHYVSQVINQDLNSNFYELINQSRIEDAKKRLARCPGQTVLEIALAVGFNSKSTFNAAFRRNTGKTPSEYRASHGKKVT